MKTIIIQLIREDIKQTRFIQQLNNLGLSADEHLLNLSPVIFDLMELDRSTPEKSDAVLNRYREMIEFSLRAYSGGKNLSKQAEKVLLQLISEFGESDHKLGVQKNLAK